MDSSLFNHLNTEIAFPHVFQSCNSLPQIHPALFYSQIELSFGGGKDLINFQIRELHPKLINSCVFRTLFFCMAPVPFQGMYQLNHWLLSELTFIMCFKYRQIKPLNVTWYQSLVHGEVRVGDGRAL